MTVKWNILSASGAGADLVQMLLESNHVPAIIDSECPDATDMIVITRALDDYAWVMLCHWQLFTRDHPEQYKTWVDQHYCGRGYPEKADDLRADDWADHVVASYEHIVKYEAVNNSVESITQGIKNSPRLYLLALYDLLTDPEGTMTRLSRWTRSSLAEASRTQFLEHVAQRKADCKEWTERVRLLRPSTRVY